MTRTAMVASLSRTVLAVVLLVLVTSLDLDSSLAATTGVLGPSIGQTSNGTGGWTTPAIANRGDGFRAGGEASAHRYDGSPNVVRPITRSISYRSAPNTTRGVAGVADEALRGGAADVHVYHGVSGGKNVYAGITNDLARRQAQHGSRFVLEPVTTSPVTRGQARAIEEALIGRNPGFEGRL